MLVELDIKNFAIIKSLKVRFQEKMTVIIGETGAGKSIIIDAVSLLMGGRGQLLPACLNWIIKKRKLRNYVINMDCPMMMIN